MAKKGGAREGGTGEHSLPDHGYHQGDGAGFEKGYQPAAGGRRCDRQSVSHAVSE